MHILVLQHEEIEHLGVFKTFLEQDGVTWQVVELDKGEPIPALDSFNGMIVMGGPQDVWQEDRYPSCATRKLRSAASWRTCGARFSAFASAISFSPMRLGEACSRQDFLNAACTEY